MLQRIKTLNKDLMEELTSSPYWRKRKIVKKHKLSTQYSIHFYNDDFLITTEIDGEGVLFFINNKNDFPLPSHKIKILLRRMQLERELKGWNKPPRRKYSQIKSQIFNEILDET